MDSNEVSNFSQLQNFFDRADAENSLQIKFHQLISVEIWL